MKNRKFILFWLLVLSSSFFVQAQTKPKPAPQKSIVNAIKSTPAYAEVLLRETELESTLEDLTESYTEEYPKVKDTRFELGVILKEMNKILAVSVSETSKSTLALGKLIVRRAELETDLWSLRQQYGDDHPNVKRARRKLAVFEKAIKEILP